MSRITKTLAFLLTGILDRESDGLGETAGLSLSLPSLLAVGFTVAAMITGSPAFGFAALGFAFLPILNHAVSVWADKDKPNR